MKKESKIQSCQDIFNDLPEAEQQQLLTEHHQKFRYQDDFAIGAAMAELELAGIENVKGIVISRPTGKKTGLLSKQLLARLQPADAKRDFLFFAWPIDNNSLSRLVVTVVIDNKKRIISCLDPHNNSHPEIKAQMAELLKTPQFNGFQLHVLPTTAPKQLKNSQYTDVLIAENIVQIVQGNMVVQSGEGIKQYTEVEIQQLLGQYDYAYRDYFLRIEKELPKLYILQRQCIQSAFASLAITDLKKPLATDYQELVSYLAEEEKSAIAINQFLQNFKTKYPHNAFVKILQNPQFLDQLPDSLLVDPTLHTNEKIIPFLYQAVADLSCPPRPEAKQEVKREIHEHSESFVGDFYTTETKDHQFQPKTNHRDISKQERASRTKAYEQAKLKHESRERIRQYIIRAMVSAFIVDYYQRFDQEKSFRGLGIFRMAELVNSAVNSQNAYSPVHICFDFLQTGIVGDPNNHYYPIQSVFNFGGRYTTQSTLARQLLAQRLQNIETDLAADFKKCSDQCDTAAYAPLLAEIKKFPTTTTELKHQQTTESKSFAQTTKNQLQKVMNSSIYGCTLYRSRFATIRDYYYPGYGQKRSLSLEKELNAIQAADTLNVTFANTCKLLTELINTGKLPGFDNYSWTRFFSWGNQSGTSKTSLRTIIAKEVAGAIQQIKEFNFEAMNPELTTILQQKYFSDLEQAAQTYQIGTQTKKLFLCKF